MADTSQERTEEPTQYRLEEAAEKGQVPYSRELTAAVLFMMVMVGLRFLGPELASRLKGLFHRLFSLQEASEVTQSGAPGLLGSLARDALSMLLPLLGAVVGVTLMGGIVQIGLRLSARRIEPDWSRIDPLKGMRKLFSSRSAMAVLFSVLKLVAVGLVAWQGILAFAPLAADAASTSFAAMVALLPATIFGIGFKVGGLIMLLGVVDLLWQRWKHGQDLKMTKEEVKEDRKRSEGDPRLKARVRQLQREIARARMMQDVKKATVVVRNPTHYAVALRYENGKDPSPRVVAKGRNLIALRIIEIAEKARVPIRSDPPLARRIFKTVPLGKTIPEELFRAVAKVIAWVMKQRRKAAA